MRLGRWAYTVALLLVCWSLAGQTGHLPHVARGKVTDARSGRAIPAVSVSVPGRNYTTVSNEDGRFVIKSDVPIQALEFSCMGYKTLRQQAQDGFWAIRLEPDKYLLDASSIISGDPEEIVRSALLSIRDNYSDRTELLRCFYRETLQKRGRYISVSEAVARIARTSYLWSGNKDDAALDKSRIIMSQRRRDTLSVKMMGGPSLAATLDAIKNRDVFIYDIHQNYYSFQMEQPAYIGDRLQFVIRCIPQISVEYPLYSGILYIDQENLCITRLELSLDMSDPVKATQMLLVKKPFTLRFTPKEASLVMTYKKGEYGYRLEYFRSTIRFNCDWKKRMIATSYTVVNEAVITDVILPAVPIDRREVFRPTDYMADKAVEFLDPAFWADYNIIEPSESLEHAVSHLRKN